MHEREITFQAAQRVARDAEDPLASITPEALQQDFAINALSPLLAAQEAVKGFKQLDDSASKTFIFTGNLLNEDWLVRPDVLTFASSKTAAAKWIKYASVAYKSKGFK
jgi:NAD(P)-dependent dehydrogenase (short-subunit alcohol dehydrogenase family)